MRCDRGMYACIAGNCGSASLGFTLIYQAGLAGRRFSAFTRLLRSLHAPFPSSFRLQVGKVTQRSSSSEPLFSARRISSWVKWRTASAYLAHPRKSLRGRLALGGGATRTRPRLAGSDALCSAVRKAAWSLPPHAGPNAATAYRQVASTAWTRARRDL